jgi:hypothetical protein
MIVVVSPSSGSTRFSQVPAIGSGASLRGDIERWLDSAPLRELVRAFGGGVDGRLGLSARLAWLDAFTERWDTRQGRERNQAGELDLTAEQRELAKPAGDALGLRGPETLRFDHYDHVLMLGGLVRACLARPATAAQLLRPSESGGAAITAGAITALGGHRPFAGDEFAQAAREGLPDLAEEYEALDAGTRRAFDLGEPISDENQSSPLPGGSWSIRTYQWQPAPEAASVPVRVVAAPSSEPERRRADTPDSYAFFAERIAALGHGTGEPGAGSSSTGTPSAGGSGTRLLLISTAIHVLPQHLAALRILGLPYHAEIDTVSARAGSVPGMPLANFTPTKYLLEIRYTIRLLRQLVEALGPEPGSASL